MRPVQVGEVVQLRARVTATFRTSMEIEVNVHGEDSRTRERWPCVDAFVVFVAIDAARQAHVPVPPLLLDSEEIRHSQAAGERRRQWRLGKR